MSGFLFFSEKDRTTHWWIIFTSAPLIFNQIDAWLIDLLQRKPGKVSKPARVRAISVAPWRELTGKIWLDSWKRKRHDTGCSLVSSHNCSMQSKNNCLHDLKIRREITIFKSKQEEKQKRKKAHFFFKIFFSREKNELKANNPCLESATKSLKCLAFPDGKRYIPIRCKV